MEPGGSMLHSKGLSNNPYLEPDQPNSPHWYLSHQGLPKGLFPVGVLVKILKALLPSFILATWPASQSFRLNHPDYIRWTVQTMKFLIVEPSPLLGLNIRLRIQFSDTLALHSSFNVRHHASQSYSTTGNATVLYILIFLNS
jgi:hypothetical protein